MTNEAAAYFSGAQEIWDYVRRTYGKEDGSIVMSAEDQAEMQAHLDQLKVNHP